jgi:hypothetical protein
MGNVERAPNEPHAWVLLSGLQDFYTPPHRLHTVEELHSALEKWIASRVNHWPKIARHFAFNVSGGKVAFQSEEVKNNPSVDGVMLYGTSPFDAKVTYAELSDLGRTLAVLFGQPFVEFNLQGVVSLITRNEETIPI